MLMVLVVGLLSVGIAVLLLPAGYETARIRARKR